jgi:fumarate reductase subunit C
MIVNAARGAQRRMPHSDRARRSRRTILPHEAAAMSTPAAPLSPAAAPARPRKSRWPAKLDLAQSLTGLVLGLFMWGHMLFVSSILLGKDAMWIVTKAFEGYFIFGTAYPGIVSVVVAVVSALFIAHAALALRKFPINYRQVSTMRGHMAMMRHGDTTLWWWQVATGFAMFFLASVHLYQMLMHPADIGPYESGARVWNGWWPLYLGLLFAVELHVGIGLYRLAVKWNWLGGRDDEAKRRRLKKLKWALSVFFIALGLATLAAYMKIGYEIRDTPGIRYTPAWLADPPQAPPPAWWPSWLKQGS